MLRRGAFLRGFWQGLSGVLLLQSVVSAAQKGLSVIVEGGAPARKE